MINLNKGKPRDIPPGGVDVETPERDRAAAAQSYEILDTAAEDTFDEFVALAAAIVEAPVALIVLVTADRLEVKAKLGWTAPPAAREKSLCEHTLGSADVLVVPDAAEDERFLNHPWVALEPKIRFYAGAPLIDTDGHALGVLCVMDLVVREFSFEQKDALLSLSRYVVAQLELRKRLALFKRNDRTRRDSLAALKFAVRGGEFVVHYQPKISLLSGETAGLEALIRWDRPGHGLVSPNDFIPLLEESGLILEVGAWVLGQSADHHLDWTKKGLNAPRIAVNVSPAQFRDANFIAELQRLTGAGGERTGGVDLEISESVLAGNTVRVIAKLQAIRDMGVGVAVDKFGTGPSSWGYLARLAIDTIKIDRSFVSAMTTKDGLAVVSCMISLAHGLHLKVVAEGVETEAQRELLRGLGCDEVQGYLISHPLTKRETENLLSASDERAFQF